MTLFSDIARFYISGLLQQQEEIARWVPILAFWHSERPESQKEQLMKLTNCATIVAAFSSLILSTSCEIAEPNETSGFITRVVEAEGVEIYRLSVERDWRGTEVEGAIRPVWDSMSLSSGHLDIKIEMPNGETAQKIGVAAVESDHSPSLAPRDHRAFFRADFDVIAPEGSIVLLTYHSSRHDG